MERDKADRVNQQRAGEAPYFRALATQQAALRRVATLVARGVSPSELFPTVAAEMARCLDVRHAVVCAFEPDDALTIVGAYDEDRPAKLRLGERLALDGDSIATRVLSNGRPARIEIRDHTPGSVAGWVRELGLPWRVGAPIVVNGRIWGLAVVGSPLPQPLPLDTEARIGEFADLVATAIAAATTRAALEASLDRISLLAEQQAALRRVATIVACELAPTQVFAAVAEEMARCMRVQNAAVLRYGADGAATIVCRNDPQTAAAAAERYSPEVDHIAAVVLATGQPARVESHNRHAVAAPIVVDGRVWGLAVVASAASQPLPPTTEDHIGGFADLAATAIRNTAVRAELHASRQRVVTAADDARRQLERDLHDGAQQRLVALAIEAGTAKALVPPELDDLTNRLSRIVSGVIDVSEEVSVLSHGIRPAILARGGLGPALKTMVRRCGIDSVTLDLGLDRRLPESVEVAAYYVVAEALANAAKHAQASEITVRAVDNGDTLEISICDNGIGGADFSNGSGLIGLTDRVEALDGRLDVVSPPEVGTSLSVSIPVDRR
ncbi:histidine kinase,GAF domain-containing protein [Mycobacterium sp. JS623]|nr:histidine kinase,GAF domain-containing protein [Mycobacterium sp. JS623]